jgi:hypothetical protein
MLFSTRGELSLSEDQRWIECIRSWERLDPYYMKI